MQEEKIEYLIESGESSIDVCSAILNHPDLFKYITEVELAKQIVGETDTIKTIFLASCGSFVENGNKTSYNLIVNDESGAGKDWVTTKTLKIFPSEKYIKRTRITEKVFTYWHNPKLEPDWTWDGKIFYNEDISDSVLNSEVFKVMASTGSQATIIVDQVSMDIDIKGKPILIVTTAKAVPNAENLRRWTLVSLDSTVNQTEEIIKRQAEAAERGLSLEYNDIITHALGILERVKVKVPFAKNLIQFFPSKNIIMRTVFERFLDYIKASAALFQKQRQTDMDGYILANEDDYKIARTVFLKTTSNQYMIPITKEQRKLLQIIKDFGDEYSSVAEIESKVTFMSDRWLRTNLDKLADINLLSKSIEVREGSDKKVMVYKILEIITNFTLPEAIAEQLY